MKLETLAIGDIYYTAHVFAAGRELKNTDADLWSTPEEAEEDGRAIASWHDPEWQKRNPGRMEVVVRKYVVRTIASKSFAVFRAG